MGFFLGEESESVKQRNKFIENLKVGDFVFLRDGTKLEIAQVLEKNMQWLVKWNKCINSPISSSPHKQTIYKVVNSGDIFREDETDVAIKIKKQKEEDYKKRKEDEKMADMLSVISRLSVSLQEKFKEANFLPHKLEDSFYYLGDGGVSEAFIKKIVLTEGGWKFISEDDNIFLEYKIDSHVIKNISGNAFASECEAEKVYKKLVESLKRD